MCEPKNHVIIKEKCIQYFGQGLLHSSESSILERLSPALLLPIHGILFWKNSVSVKSEFVMKIVKVELDDCFCLTLSL